MSAVIDPILRTYPGDHKITTVIMGRCDRLGQWVHQVQGLEAVTQILGAYLFGAGTTAAIGFIKQPTAFGNTVGISLTTAPIGISAALLVQGY